MDQVTPKSTGWSCGELANKPRSKVWHFFIGNTPICGGEFLPNEHAATAAGTECARCYRVIKVVTQHYESEIDRDAEWVCQCRYCRLARQLGY